MHFARAGAAAIAAMALSPTYAAPPKPIVDLSQSPALSDNKSSAAPTEKTNGLDQTTMELGGGALALLILSGGALILSRRKRRREEESWQYDDEPVAEQPVAAQAEPVTANQPMAQPEPALVAPPLSAFNWGNEPRRESAGDGDCEDLESWTERAKCGPTEDNPSQSLKKRMKRAAFFEKRDREVAAGQAAPVDPDAGLPENLDESEMA